MSINAVAEAVRQGKELLCGETLVTASVAITTNFAIIDAVLITGKRSDAPGDETSMYTYDVSDNVVTLYGWKTTSGSDPTKVAATDETTVGYIIMGRRR